MHGASTQGAHGHGCDANRTHNYIITIPCKQFARCNWYGDRKLEHCIIVSTELHAKKNSHHRLNVWIWFRHALYTSALIERAGCALNSEPSEIRTGTHEVRTQIFTYLFPIRTIVPVPLMIGLMAVQHAMDQRECGTSKSKGSRYASIMRHN